MADLNYDVSVSTTQAEASLTRLQKTVGGLNDTFIRLKSTLATISLGAVISQSLQFADAISDLSDASEIAIGNIIGFQNAVMASGGSADGAQKAILRLVNSIGEAAEGSASMQRAFSEVGVTLDDLARLSNQDILQKTITGLDKITDSSKRSTLVTQLLGKEFRNVAAGGLGAAYADATAKSAQYADAIAKGAAAQQNIDKTLGEFKIGLLEAVKPLTDLISKVNIGVENFQRFVQALLAVGAAFAAFSIIGRVWKLFVLLIDGAIALYGALTNLGAFLGQLATGWRVIFSATEGAGGAFYRVWLSIKAVGAALTEILGPAFTTLKAVGAPVLATIAGYWGWIQTSTGAAIDKLKEYLNYLPGVNFTIGGGAGRGNGQAELDQRKKDAEAAKKQSDAIREVTDALAKRRAEIQKASTAFREQNNQIIDNLNLEKSFIGKSEEFIEVEKAREEIFKRASAESAKLQEAKKALGKDEQSLAAVYDQQIAKIVEASRVDAERVARSVEGLQGLRMVEKGRLQDIENVTKAIEAQMSRQQALGDIIRGANDQAQAARDATPASQLVGLNSIQRQVLEIQESARKAANEAARAFAANFEDDGDGLTPERARELAQGLNQIATAYKGVAVAQTEVAKANYETSRSFSTGWTEAFAKYAEDAQNAAQQASTYFDRFTKGFEDAVVALVTNGKFSFKDFANSIIADFARIEARKALTSFMSGATPGGSVLGSLFNFGKSLFGMAANGGPISGPTLVGEHGVELFRPSGSGYITSNRDLKNGGGQAQVINNAVTYQIQAVDASSFRSLVARDPSFIYAVTEQGRRSQPTRRSA